MSAPLFLTKLLDKHRSEIDRKDKRIAELEKERDEREKSLKKLLYCCDGLSTEYAQNNHGEVQEWLRHVDAAYQALKEKG